MRRRTGLSRRVLLRRGAALAGIAVPLSSIARANDDAVELIRQLTGKVATPSDRVHLLMPRVFPNGYTVPLAVDIDSPMTESDHVRSVRVFAPRNPLVEVVAFHFTPRCGRARVSTRIRLAEPQQVLGVAQMSDGALLMNAVWVEVASNGCA